MIKGHLQWQCCLQYSCQEVGYVFPLLKKAQSIVCVYLSPVTKIYQNLHLMYIFSGNIVDSEFFFVVLHYLCSSPNIILGEHVVCGGEKRNTYAVLVGKR